MDKQEIRKMNVLVTTVVEVNVVDMANAITIKVGFRLISCDSE